MFGGRMERDGLEMSLRFRRMLEERIERLERDADHDAAQIPLLDDVDHIRRQMKLVSAERAEARRMRLLLECTRAERLRPPIPR